MLGSGRGQFTIIPERLIDKTSVASIKRTSFFIGEFSSITLVTTANYLRNLHFSNTFWWGSTADGSIHVKAVFASKY